ncbi:Lipoate-protein ligase B [Cladobotryum mycophilum]|uniref:lipoyl(octanoyl) transferase n=1 Tax=Cladobotryum mycophilum TaxID=491253 RepID=A0ABR0SG02_9HYPO
MRHMFRLWPGNSASALLRRRRPCSWPCRGAVGQLFSSSSKPSLFVHRHLKAINGEDLVPYDEAEEHQEQLRKRHLEWKSTESGEPLVPHLLSFESRPIYTLGRRQGNLTPGEEGILQRQLFVNLHQRNKHIQETFLPDVKKTNRGGLTTYHGPGQLVLWPVLDMHSPLYPKYSVSSYASHLEATTQRLLDEVFNVKSFTSHDEPGVWVESPAGQPRKIAALGVHHRRYITALGTAINIDIKVTGDAPENPWVRFIPCGIEGKEVTSVAEEIGIAKDNLIFDLEDLARQWARIFEEGLVDASKRGRFKTLMLAFDWNWSSW